MPHPIKKMITPMPNNFGSGPIGPAVNTSTTLVTPNCHVTAIISPTAAALAPSRNALVHGDLRNGNIIVGNCHAGPDNPQLIEVTRDKKVVWTFKNFKTFGNSVAAAHVLGLPDKTVR